MHDFTVVVRKKEEVEHYRKRLAGIGYPDAVVRLADDSERRDLPDGANLPLIYTKNNTYEGETSVLHFIARLEKKISTKAEKDFSCDNILNFILTIGTLKNTYRFQDKKKKNRRKKNYDTVAEHSWRVAMMAMTFAEELLLDIDIYYAVKIALVHDLGEYLHGDIDERKINRKEFTKEQKKQQEEKGFIALKNILSSKFGDYIYALWEDFEEAKSKEAKFVVALDKLETIQQIIENGYKTYNTPDLTPNYADKAVSEFPALLPALRSLKSDLKKEYEKGGFPWKKEYDVLMLPFIAEPRMDEKSKKKPIFYMTK